MSKVIKKQNPSGHICMDNRESMFFAEVNKKINRITIQRDAGLLPQQNRRNPINAESSPRYPGFTFDFSVPPKKAEPERWVYPDNDYGLMAKFNSQKPIFDEIRAKEENYATIVKEFRKVRKQNEEAYHKELVREFDKKNEIEDPDMNELTNVPHRIHRQAKDVIGTLDRDDEMILKGIANHSKSGTRQRTQNHQYYGINQQTTPKTVDFIDQKISKIKGLHTTHPEVLEKWRAERAAEFISKGGQKFVDPPPARILSTMPFHPAGKHRVDKEPLSVVKKPKVKVASSSRMSPPVEGLLTMRENIETLQTSIRETNCDIERQRLLIALNTKQRGYERAFGARTSDSL